MNRPKVSTWVAGDACGSSCFRSSLTSITPLGLLSPGRPSQSSKEPQSTDGRSHENELLEFPIARSATGSWSQRLPRRANHCIPFDATLPVAHCSQVMPEHRPGDEAGPSGRGVSRPAGSLGSGCYHQPGKAVFVLFCDHTLSPSTSLPRLSLSRSCHLALRCAGCPPLVHLLHISSCLGKI